MRLVIWIVLGIVAGGASAQQNCQDVPAVLLQCPDGLNIEGDPPSCFCNGQAVEPLDLSCLANFGCPSSGEIGMGDWPDCSCRPADASPDSGGSSPLPDSGVNPGLGGLDVCSGLYYCEGGGHLVIVDGRCACQVDLEMLPPG